jgi:hypothetical protein
MQFIAVAVVMMLWLPSASMAFRLYRGKAVMIGRLAGGGSDQRSRTFAYFRDNELGENHYHRITYYC